MRRDPMYLTAAGGRPDGLRRLAQPRWPLLWLAVALGSALFLAVALAQAVRAAGEAIQLGATTLSVDERHSTSYSVFLAGDKPSSDVVVDITSSNSDVKPSPKSLTFTPANYRTSQPVTLRAANDDDSRNERATITHVINVTSSADSFDEVADVTLTVNVMDDDAVGTTFSSGTGDGAFDPTTAPVKVDEGSDAEYTVELQSAPTSDVTVTLTSSNEAAVTVSPATIMLKSTDFGAKTVKVRGVDDKTTNDETVTITHAFASTDDDYDGRSEVVTVEVSDDETAGVTFAPSPLKLNIAEGASDTYTVVLADKPTHDVTVRISSDNGDVSPLGNPLTGRTLMFTPDNWKGPQTVTVEVGSDDDAADEPATITHAVSSADANYNSAAIIEAAVDALDAKATDVEKAAARDSLKGTVTVTDVNVGVRISPATVEVDEGSSAKYTVELQSAPTSDVTVTLTSSNTDAVTVSPATITFKSTDVTAVIVEVKGVDDATTNDETVTITHAFASTDDDYDGRSEVVTVEVSDDETAGVTFSPADVAVGLAEGASDTYKVMLAAEPTAEVTVRISSDNSDVTVDTNVDTAGNQKTLMFTTDDWDKAQTVTVTVGADADADDERATLTHAVSSTDANYTSVALIAAAGDAAVERLKGTPTDAEKARADAEAAALKVSFDVDDTNVGVRFSPATVEVVEGKTAEYTVELQSAPTHDVTVAISSDNTDVTVSPATITFESTVFNKTVTVKVTAAQEAADAEDRSDESAALKHAISSNDPRYDDLLDQTVTANVTDDDPSVTLSASEVEVVEGESGSFTVKLAVQPDSDPDADPNVKVTITVASDSDDVTVSPAELSFTTDDWDMAQTVTVTVVPDEDERDGTATVTLTVAAGDPAGSSSKVYIAEFIQTVSILLTEPQVVVEVRGPTVTVPGPTRTKTVTETVTVEVEVPAVPNVVGGTSAATATEVNGQVVITRHDGGASLVVNIGGFIRDESLGQTYQVVRRMDGMIVRQWVSPNSPLVYQIPWAVVNSQFSVPVGVIGAIPLDDQSGAAGQLVRRFDGGDDRIFSYDGMGGWRHVPDIPTFQALGLYWCDVTAADAGFFDRITIGSPHAATDMPARDDYPTCSTG